MESKKLITEWLNDVQQLVSSYLPQRQPVSASFTEGKQSKVIYHVHDHHHHNNYGYSPMSVITNLFSPHGPTYAPTPVIINNVVGSQTQGDSHANATKKEDKKEDKEEDKKKKGKKERKEKNVSEGPPTLAYALGTVVMATVGTVLYSFYQKKSEKREANLEKMLLVEELLAKEDSGLTDEVKSKLNRIFKNVKKVVSHQKTDLTVNTVGLGIGTASVVGYSLSTSPFSFNLCLLTGTIVTCGLIAHNVRNWIYHDDKIVTVAMLIQNDVLYLFDKQDDWFLPTEPLITI